MDILTALMKLPIDLELTMGRETIRCRVMSTEILVPESQQGTIEMRLTAISAPERSLEDTETPGG